MSLARRRKVAKAVGIKLKGTVSDYHGTWHNVLPLPPHIGNAAAAFDNDLAFKQYAVGS